MTLPISPKPFLILLVTCLCIVAYCHSTVAKCWISLSLCHKTNLKFCAGDSLNKYYIRIFVKKRTSVNFSSERKCCGVDQMFLKDVTNVPTRSQTILSKLGMIHQELTVEKVHVVNHGVRDTCLIKWDRIKWTWKPWPSPLLQNFIDDPPLWSPSPPTPINNVPSLIYIDCYWLLSIVIEYWFHRFNGRCVWTRENPIDERSCLSSFDHSNQSA